MQNLDSQSASFNVVTFLDEQGFEDHQKAAVIKQLAEQVDFYRLSRKFVEDKEVPEEAQHIMYYSLGVGHHLGVVDCLKSDMNCTGEEYLEWIAPLAQQQDKRAYHKMFGYLTFGEMSIFEEHIHLIALAFDKIDSQIQSEKSKVLTEGLIEILNGIFNEPNMYLMIRNTRKN